MDSYKEFIVDLIAGIATIGAVIAVSWFMAWACHNVSDFFETHDKVLPNIAATVVAVAVVIIVGVILSDLGHWVLYALNLKSIGYCNDHYRLLQ